MTAAASMARFLAYNPQFAQLDCISWHPRPTGDLVVGIRFGHKDSLPLLDGLLVALGFEAPRPVAYVSRTTHLPMVALTLRGDHDNARWLVETHVTAEAHAAFMAESRVSA
jgi:hypothetical protein